jgi:hypothetical protein
VTNQKMIERLRISTIVAIGAIMFAWTWTTDRPLSSDDLVNRPDGPIACGRTSVSGCEYRM